jgi:hypothetical protein
MLIGLLAQTTGTIEVDGIDVIHHPRRVRYRIGYMGQKVSLYAGLTLRENVEFYGGLYGLAGRDLADRWAALRDRFGRPVWRQLGVASAADFPAADERADGYVVEAKPPPGATRPGGNAVRADWALLATFRPAKPWLLAGGLNPGNVAEAIARTGAPGVDVSSGVETAPGVKSPELIRAFVRAARG